jgi:thioredoxin 2
MISQAVCPMCGAVNRIAAGHRPSAGRCGRCGESLRLNAPVETNDSALMQHLTRTQGPVVIDVWAPWCGPCRLMGPHLERAAETMSGEARFLKLNADENRSAAELGVRSIPTLILYHDGAEIARRSGLTPADQLMSWIRSETDARRSAGVA